MTATTAAQMANVINFGDLGEDAMDEDLMLAIALNCNGRKLPNTIVKCYEFDAEEAKLAAMKKAELIGFSGVSAIVEVANWLCLDWKKLPWVIPAGENLDDWLSLDAWESVAIEHGLLPENHICKASKEYHDDKVSLKLWNLRFAGV